MKREFLTNLIFLVGINLLVKPFYLFGIERGVQNTLPPGEYGLWFALFNFTFLFQIVNDFGLRTFSSRQVAQNRHMVGIYLPNLLLVKSLLGLTFLAFVGAGALLAGYSGSVLPLLFWVAGNQILSSLVLFLRANIAGLGKYRFDSLLSAADKLLLIALLAGVLWGPGKGSKLSLELFIGAQTVSLGTVALLALGWLLWYSGPVQLRWRWKRIRLLLLRSAPFALTIFLMSVYTRIDGVMVERLLPDGRLEADIYASAYRLLDAANVIGYLFASLLLPMFAYMLKEREPVAPLVRFSISLLWAGVIPVVMACVLFNEEIMVGLYRSGSAYSGQVLALLMLTFLAMSGNYVYSTLLSARGRMGPLNRIFAFTVLANVLLNLLLIPAQKAYGAALATCFTQWMAFLLQLILAIRVFRLKKAWLLVAKMVLLAAFSTALSWAMRHYWSGPWLPAFAWSLVGGLAMAVLLGLIEWSTFLRLLRRGDLRPRV